MQLFNLSLKELLAQAEQQRIELMRMAMLAYDDKSPKPLPVPSTTAIDDNVMVNYAATIVDKGVSFLFGDELKIEVGDDREDSNGLVIKDMSGEDYLNEVWPEDQRHEDLLDLGTNGGIFGHVWAKIKLTDGLPSVIVLDPLNMTAVWSDEDIREVKKFICTYPSFDEHGRSIVKKEETTREEKRWIIKEYISYSDGSSWKEVNSTDWNYEFAPIFHTKNLPYANQFYGRPDLTQGILALNYYLNRVDSLINRIIRLHGYPKVIAKGLTDQDLRIGVDGVLFLPDVEQEITQLEMSSDLKASLDFRDRMRRALAEVSHIPEITTATEKLGTLSGRAMQILYGPLLDQNKKKRLTYGRLIKDLVKGLLVIGRKEEQAKHIKLHWGDPLPADHKEEAEVALLHQQVGASQDTLLRKLGYDTEDERQKRTFDAGDTAKALLSAFDKGTGNLGMQGKDLE
jgi:hypothetical protein